VPLSPRHDRRCDQLARTRPAGTASGS